MTDKKTYGVRYRIFLKQIGDLKGYRVQIAKTFSEAFIIGSRIGTELKHRYKYLLVYSSSKTCHSATLSSILRAVALRTVKRFRRISYLENNNTYYKRFFGENTFSQTI